MHAQNIDYTTLVLVIARKRRRINWYMATSEFEPTPAEMDPTKRFYNDFHYKKDSYVDLYISAEKMIESAFVLSGEVFRENVLAKLVGDMSANILPASVQFGLHETQAQDAFLRAPLFMADVFMEGLSGFDQFRAWHTRLAEQILVKTSDVHSRECLAIGGIADGDGCMYSEVCNHRMVRAHLVGPAQYDKFEGLEYVVDAERAKSLVIAKLEVAKEHRLVSKDEADRFRNTYTRGFEYFYGK